MIDASVSGSGDGRGPTTVAIFGAGSAGFAAAIRAVELGARVVMVQEGTLGGTCVNVGCVPSKTLVRAAQARHAAAHHGFDGIGRSEASVDWARVRDEEDDLVRGLRAAKYEDVLAAYPEITMVRGRGALDSAGRPHVVGGDLIEARKTIVTTGSSPRVPEIPGLAEAGFLDSTALLDVEGLPGSLAVLGAGAVGTELAQAYARLGVDVLLVARTRVLSSEAPEVGAELVSHLRAEGLEVLERARVETVERTGAGRRLRVRLADGDAATREVEEVLVATGRRPNSEGMGLEAAGVEVGPEGEIVVDGYLRTTHADVYAAGDVVGVARCTCTWRRTPRSSPRRTR